MGRPLNKKYFGNRNIGTNGYTPVVGGNTGGDDGIGGEGVASYGSIVTGSGWTTATTVTFSAPDIPGGVSVAGTAHYKALSFSTTANGTGYNVGDSLEVVTGTAATKARAPVSSIVAVGVTLVAAGDHYNNNDIIEYRTGQDSYVTIRVTTVGGAADRPAASLAIVSGGTRTSAKPTGTLSYQNTLGGTGITFTLDWGVFSFGTVSTLGDYTVFPSTGAAGTLTSVTGTGTGAKADITMGLLSIVVTQKGSGYTSPADAAVSFTGGTGAAATAVLTTDSGARTPGTNYNAATNQDNAIIIRAKTTSGGTVQIGDIQQQKGSHRYKVKTSDGVAVCKLVATDSPLVNQAYMVATATGGTYYVTKLTAHKARLVTKTGNGVLNGKIVKWTFGAHSSTVVTIENA